MDANQVELESELREHLRHASEVACRFDEAARKAFVGDRLASNLTIQRAHFKSYVTVLGFVHAVNPLFDASVACFSKTERQGRLIATG